MLAERQNIDDGKRTRSVAGRGKGDTVLRLLCPCGRREQIAGTGGGGGKRKPHSLELLMFVVTDVVVAVVLAVVDAVVIAEAVVIAVQHLPLSKAFFVAFRCCRNCESKPRSNSCYNVGVAV